MPNKIVPGRRYKPFEIRALIDQATAKELEFRGYVLQYDALSGTYAVVHWTQASQPFRQDGSRAQRRAVSKSIGADAFGTLDPIVKRTPQQRVDSLMAKWLVEMKQAGGLPHLMGEPPSGLTTAERDDFYRRKKEEGEVMDNAIKAIVGEAWKDGRTEITADIVRTVAAHFLSEAEVQHEEKVSHQVTRHES